MRSPAGTAFVAINALILIWDVALAGRILNHRRGSPSFLALTGLAALLTVPALVVAATSSTIPNGRDVHIIEWIWPLVVGVFTLQAGVALVRGWSSASVALPVLLANFLLFGAAAMRFATTIFPALPPAVVAFGVSHARALGYAFGRGALWSPLLLQVPVLVPSYPAPHGWGQTTRAALAMWCALTSVVFLAEYPGALHAASTFAAVGGLPVRTRPAGAIDLEIGLRVFPDLSGPPAGGATRLDLGLADSLDATAVCVVVRPGSGTSAVALDSLARSLADLRSDSNTTLIVAIGFGPNDASLFRRDAEAYGRQRLLAVGNAVRSLQPDIVFPTLDLSPDSDSPLGTVSARWWRDQLQQAATLVHGIRPGTRVGVASSATSSVDSVLFAWGATPESPVDVLGLSLGSSYGGGASLLTRLHAASRLVRGVDKPVWVFASGASPRVFGERSQALALRGTLVWAAAQPKVAGYIVNGAGDYDAIIGLRAPGGRLRPALATIERTRKELESNR